MPALAKAAATACARSSAAVKAVQLLDRAAADPGIADDAHLAGVAPIERHDLSEVLSVGIAQGRRARGEIDLSDWRIDRPGGGDLARRGCRGGTGRSGRRQHRRRRRRLESGGGDRGRQRRRSGRRRQMRPGRAASRTRPRLPAASARAAAAAPARSAGGSATKKSAATAGSIPSGRARAASRPCATLSLLLRQAEPRRPVRSRS